MFERDFIALGVNQTRNFVAHGKNRTRNFVALPGNQLVRARVRVRVRAGLTSHVRSGTNATQNPAQIRYN